MRFIFGAATAISLPKGEGATLATAGMTMESSSKIQISVLLQNGHDQREVHMPDWVELLGQFMLNCSRRNFLASSRSGVWALGVELR